MSNGTFAYTQEEKAALFAQFSKSMELAREGRRDPQLVSRALQAVISDDVITVHPKVTVTQSGKIFHVTGSFNSRPKPLRPRGVN